MSRNVFRPITLDIVAMYLFSYVLSRSISGHVSLHLRDSDGWRRQLRIFSQHGALFTVIVTAVQRCEKLLC